MQQQLEQLPLIKKPLELIGDPVNVPGTFWEGRMSAMEKETLYKCVVRDHSALHKFINGPMSEAFEVQEMGAMGTGSLEHGDASGEIFWIAYPFPVMHLCLDPARMCLPRMSVQLGKDVCDSPDEGLSRGAWRSWALLLVLTLVVARSLCVCHSS